MDQDPNTPPDFDLSGLIPVDENAPPDIPSGRPWYEVGAANVARTIQDTAGAGLRGLGRLTDSEGLTQAGTRLSAGTDTDVPLSEADQQGIIPTVGKGIGSLVSAAPAVVAGGVLGGAAYFGIVGGEEQAEDAEKHGASPEVAHQAFIRGAVVNTALGAIPLHAILRPIEAAGPTWTAWGTAKLQQAIQSGVAFASVGEAQQFLASQIAQDLYDPQDGYSPDVQRIIGNLLSGAVVGPLAPLQKPISQRTGIGPEADSFMRQADEVDAKINGAKTRSEIDEFIRNKAAQKAAADDTTQRLLPPPTEAAGEPPEPAPPEAPPEPEPSPQPPPALPPKLSDRELADNLRKRLGLTDETPKEEPIPAAVEPIPEGMEEKPRENIPEASKPAIESAAQEVLDTAAQEGIGPEQIDATSLEGAAKLLATGQEKDPIDAIEQAYLEENHAADIQGARDTGLPPVAESQPGEGPGTQEPVGEGGENGPSAGEGGKEPESAVGRERNSDVDRLYDAVKKIDAKGGEVAWHAQLKKELGLDTKGLSELLDRASLAPDAVTEDGRQLSILGSTSSKTNMERINVGQTASTGIAFRPPNKPIIERFPGENGTEVLIVKNSDGKRYNVVLRDTDAQQTAGVKIYPTLDRARAAAQELANPEKPPLDTTGLTPVEETPTPPGLTAIGQNSDGQTLYEDARGVRSYVENGIRHTEPVAMVPSRNGMGISVDRNAHPEYKTAEEAANDIQPSTGDVQVNVPPSTEGPGPEGVPAPNEERPIAEGGPGEGGGSPQETSSVGEVEPPSGPERAEDVGGGGAGADVGLPPEPGDISEPGRDEVPVLGPAANVTGVNHVIEPGTLMEERGWAQKARDNVRSIELALKIENEARLATREEQQELAKYVGWGGIKGAFPDSGGNFGKGYEVIGARLKELLPDDEYATARRSIQYAHYTAEPVVRAMWEAVQRMGFKGGQIYEPGMGVGNFAGMMPGDVASNSHYIGLEYDKTTARIAKLLYPKWGVSQGDFTRTPLPENTFDLAIGNPPFADTVIKADPKYADKNMLLHDYFFAKSLDGVKPGGVVAFISSAGTMNKADPSARQYLADRADLVGAIRLPSNAFRKNAGTDVTTDIIFLRKRHADESPGDRSWTEVTPVDLPDSDGNIQTGNNNKYFVDHPEMVLGDQGWFDKLYKGRYGVHARPGQDFTRDLAEAIARLPEGVFNVRATDSNPIADFASTEKKDGSFYIGPNGVLYQMDNGAGVPVAGRGKGVTGGKTSEGMEIIRGLIPIKNSLRDVYVADLSGDIEGAVKARAELNKSYDSFVAKHGPINKENTTFKRPTKIQAEGERDEAREEARYLGDPFDEGSFDPTEMKTKRPIMNPDGSITMKSATTSQIANARETAREAAKAAGKTWDEGTFNPEEMDDIAIVKRPNLDPFMDDPESYRLSAIEKYDKSTGNAKKSLIFTDNIIAKEKPPEIKSTNDAVLNVLNKLGRLDIPEVAKLVGKTEQGVIEDLGDRIFQVPGTQNTWQTKEQYLSGNVKQKLEMARAMAQKDPAFNRNVEALEAAQPAPLPPSRIRAYLGMPWIPPKVIQQFGTEHLGLDNLKVKYVPALAQWFVSGDTYSIAASSTWGIDERRAPLLIQDALNRQNPKIMKPYQEDGQTKYMLDVAKTQAAQEKVKALKEAFANWVWEDPDRSDNLAGIYNDGYNTNVDRVYDGSYLTTPGISKEWSWRPHQTRVVARIIESGNTYMAHAVGAGKTSAMIGAVMEMRRLGLVRKPMIVVPNHMLAQFAKEFYEQYPTAKIAVADERQFHTDRRKQFVANVANDDLDAVIITHSAFKKIPISDKFSDKIIEDAVEEYREMLNNVPNDRENKLTRSRIEKQIERLEQRLSGKKSKNQDQVFTFEEMGIDHLSIDEAHNFRKLDFATQMSNVKGINPVGSKMSWDLYVKTRYLDQQNPGRSIVLASGTPVTNTMAELFTLSRYLQEGTLKEMGLDKFDAWAGSFGDTKEELEQDAAGGYKPVTRFSKFVNVPTLSSMVRQVMDVVTSKQLGQYVTRPTIKGGRRLNQADKSEALTAYQAQLAQRMEAIKRRRGPPKKGDDIMLSVINDGRHAAIDMRLVDNTYKSNVPSKLDLLVNNAHSIYEQTTKKDFHSVVPSRSNSGEPIMMYSEKPTSTGPATQMIFANLGLSGGRGFSVPDYIRAELVRRGVPRDQIANIADYKSHTDKQKLFNDMNEGKVRFLIGSTAKMATGVNAQKRLYAIHNLDPLWYPSDDEQRIGRALRQGNMNPEIEIHDYATNGTYDSSMWKMMGRKAKFIQDFFEGDPNLVEMDDLGEASQYEQASAITTNDPRLIQLTELRQDLEKAQRRQSAFESEVYAIKGRQKEAEKKIQYANDDIVRLEDNIKKRQDITGDKFKATTLGKTYTKRADFADALFKNLQKISTADNKGKKFDVGEIGGFPLNAEVQEYTSFGGGQGTQKTYSPALTMKLSGGDGYFRNIRANTPIGLVQSMESVLKSFEGDIEDKKSDIAKNKKFLKDSKEKSEAKFTGGPEIERLKQEVRDLEASMKTPDTPPPPEADPDLYTMDELNEIGEENDPTESARADGKSLPARTADVVKLAKIIQGIVGDKVKMEFPDIISAGNKSSWGDLSADTWGGVYAPMANLIKVAMADPIFPNKIDTAYHESWHAVEDHFATPMEMALLKKEEPELRRIVQKELDRQKNAVDKISDTEIRAIAFEAYARDRTSGAGLSHGIRRFFERMINILRRVRNSIHGYGFKTSADLFDAAFSGKMKERESRRETGLGSRLADANIDTAYKNNPAMRNSEIEKYRKMAREQVPKRAAGGRVEASNIAEPTPAQAKAGNYSKDHINVHGLNISIENAKGSYRHGVGKDGKAWRSRLPAHYGYIRGTEAKDLDHVDCYIGPYIRSHHVYVIDQLNADTGKYDEAKCFIGFPSRFAALNAFHEAFSDGLAGKRFGHIKEMTMDEFKTWLRDGNTKKPVRYKEAA